MNFNYYPGCSLHGAAADYRMSINAICRRLKMDLTEIEDWNCCGATAASSENYKMALVLAALNLVKCENESELVVACNACYQRLLNVNSKFKKYPAIKEEITAVLAEFGISGDPEKIKVRHLLEIFLEEVGLEKIKSNIVKPLSELRLIPYYGCMLVRPEGFDDPEQPTALDELLTALGAQVLPFYRKTRCCGNAVMSTNEKTALKMIKEILEEAHFRGGQAIVVTCPVCQLNLDAYQDKVNKEFGTSYNIPVLYFTQAMGLAFGIGPNKLGFDRGIVPREDLLKLIPKIE
ncbi:MAG: CoB--CoM heterodisulfide reductase subunit [Clostridiales bacterium]|jgi:heterodisulfide reductase subunit B|nr:CoB--CoM heterodisulfide reductase subunit [Clostridiales bacterium]